MKLIKILKRPIVIIWLVFIIASLIIINQTFNTEGVSIKSVEQDSSAYNAGIRVDKEINPRNREIIKCVNIQSTKDLDDYHKIVNSIENETAFTIRTNEREYTLLKNDNIGLSVDKTASNNLRLGLDLQGGTRVLLKPKEKVDEDTMQQLVDITDNRLNAFGVGDVSVRSTNDLFTDNQFIVVEVAGATKEDVQEKVKQQGKFEAKIGDDLVFTGEKSDIINVCRNDGTCAYVRNCGKTPSNDYSCKFEFSVVLSEEAAKRQAELTKNLDINGTSGLSKTLDLYLDGKFIDSLSIAPDLKGRPATQVSISGPGKGSTKKEAEENAIAGMHELQTVLVTGSLPVELNIERLDYISPIVGSEVLNNAIKAGLIALVVVALIVFLRYKKFKISVPMMIIAASEILITLGIAALLKWDLDLAAIAGIIAAVGTGVDDQIVIADETSKGEGNYNWKERLKRAFSIIMLAYITTVAVMITLFWAGAGLFKGFAFTTIVGVTIGVFITRPAFGAIVEELTKES